MVHRWSTRGRKGSFFVVIRRTKNLLEDFVIIKYSKDSENLEKVLKSAHNPKVRGSNPLPATNFKYMKFLVKSEFVSIARRHLKLENWLQTVHRVTKQTELNRVCPN
jgi:hypothetical protein